MCVYVGAEEQFMSQHMPGSIGSFCSVEPYIIVYIHDIDY